MGRRSNSGGGGEGDARSRSQRQLRVGEVMRHALVDVLARGDVRDPDVAGASITVSEVRVSPDLKNATVFVLPLGGRGAEAVLRGLDRSSAYLRAQVAKLINLRHAPRLSFTADRSFDQAEHINRLLHSPVVAADLAHDEDDADGRADDDRA